MYSSNFLVIKQTKYWLLAAKSFSCHKSRQMSTYSSKQHQEQQQERFKAGLIIFCYKNFFSSKVWKQKKFYCVWTQVNRQVITSKIKNYEWSKKCFWSFSNVTFFWQQRFSFNSWYACKGHQCLIWPFISRHVSRRKSLWFKITLLCRNDVVYFCWMSLWLDITEIAAYSIKELICEDLLG